MENSGCRSVFYSNGFDGDIIFPYYATAYGTGRGKSFFKAYDLASDMLFQEKKDQYGNRLMRQTDVDSTTYLHSASSIYRWYDTFWDPVDVSEITSNIKWATVSDTTPAYSYLFSALGIALSRLCRVNGHLLLLFGRWFNLLGVAAIMAVALYLVPFGKNSFVCSVCCLR